MYAKRDWGFAPEYCEECGACFSRKTEDYVLATGETHSVKEFIDAVFTELEMDLVWKGEKKKK